MAGDRDAMAVDPSELASHQRRIGALTERVGVACDAARVTLSPDAFGVFGGGLAEECARSQREGGDMLRVALTASDVHCQKIGSWIGDLDAHELDLVAMFEVIGGDDDH